MKRRPQRVGASFTFPASNNHRALAEYWGEQARICLARLEESPQHAAFNIEHAERCGRLAGHHALRIRGASYASRG